MRINLLAGPGSGKSTLASGLFSKLKRDGYSVELVTEYVKTWAYQKREINKFDQIYLMGKQMNYEYRFLSNGVSNIITDSPVFLSAAYTKFYHSEELYQNMIGIIRDYDKEYPFINIFIERSDKNYNPHGRNEDYNKAIELDRLIKEATISVYGEIITFNFYQETEIYDFIKSKLI